MDLQRFIENIEHYVKQAEIGSMLYSEIYQIRVANGEMSKEVENEHKELLATLNGIYEQI